MIIVAVVVHRATAPVRSLAVAARSFMTGDLRARINMPDSQECGTEDTRPDFQRSCRNRGELERVSLPGKSRPAPPNSSGSGT